jgi:hypothetical protein
MNFILATLSYNHAKWLAALITIVVLVIALVAAGAAGPAKASQGEKTPRLLRVLLGADGRLSTSRAVALGWTAVVTYVFVALIVANPKSWSEALKNLSPTSAPARLSLRVSRARQGGRRHARREWHARQASFR